MSGKFWISACIYQLVCSMNDSKLLCDLQVEGGLGEVKNSSRGEIAISQGEVA